MRRKDALIVVQLCKKSFRRLHIPLDADRAEQSAVPYHREGGIDRLQIFARCRLVVVIPSSDDLLRPQRFDRGAVVFIHIENVQQLFAAHIHIVRQIHHLAEHPIVVHDPKITVVDLHTVGNCIQRALQQLLPLFFAPCQNTLDIFCRSIAVDRKTAAHPYKQIFRQIPVRIEKIRQALSDPFVRQRFLRLRKNVSLPFHALHGHAAVQQNDKIDQRLHFRSRSLPNNGFPAGVLVSSTIAFLFFSVQKKLSCILPRTHCRSAL